MSVALEVFCREGDIFEPTLGLELLCVGAPKRLRPIYTPYWRENSSALGDGDGGYGFARGCNNGRAERDYIVMGSLCTSQFEYGPSVLRVEIYFS